MMIALLQNAANLIPPEKFLDSGRKTLFTLNIKCYTVHFNGVSTKYLNRYLAMFVALEQAGRSLFHPDVDSVRTVFAHGNTALPIQSLCKDGLLVVLTTRSNV